MAVRTITGTIIKPSGVPWAGVAVKFRPVDDSYTLSPDASYPLSTITAITNADGEFSVTLAAGLSVAYQIEMPDGETFSIVVSEGSATTLELLRAAYDGANPAALPTLDLMVAEMVENSEDFEDLLEALVIAHGGQPLDADLTAIAALTPSNDDVIQRKSGAWTNRTMAQLLTDVLAALGYTPVNQAGDTMTGSLAVRGSTLTHERYAADANGNTSALRKSRHATPGSHTIVQSGDTLGTFAFQGSNGTSFDSAATVSAAVDGTPGASADMPGRLVFSTSPDGSVTPAERLRIDQAGRLLYASATVGTAAAGLMAYDGTVWEWAENATSGWTVGVNEHVFELNADGSAIGATIADFFGSTSSISLPASSRWLLEAHLYYTKTTAGTVTYTITNSAANYTNIAAKYLQSPAAGHGTNASTTGAGITGTTTAAAALPATASLTTAVQHHAVITATIDMNAAGSVRIKCTESAGTITPLRGSFYRVRRLPTSIGTFVA